MNQTKPMFQINKKYKIRVNAGVNVLTYTCIILEIDNYSIKIVDNRNQVQNISLGAIINFEELKEGGSV